MALRWRAVGIAGLLVSMVATAGMSTASAHEVAEVSPEQAAVLKGELIATPEELEALGFAQSEVDAQAAFLETLSTTEVAAQDQLRDEAELSVPEPPPLVQGPAAPGTISPLTTQIACGGSSSYAYWISNAYYPTATNKCFQGAGTYYLPTPFHTIVLQPNSWKGRVLWAFPAAFGGYGPKVWSVWRGPTAQKYSFDSAAGQHFVHAVQLVCPSSCPV